MSRRGVTVKSPGRTLRVTATALLAAALLPSLAVRVTAQTGGGRVASSGRERLDRKRLTPGQVTRELKELLARDGLPWQGYSHYADFYLDTSERVLQKKASSEGAKALQRQWVDYYRNLSELVDGMGAEKRVKEEIRTDNSDLPQARRAQAFLTARAKYRELRQQFLQELTQPPKASRRPSTQGGQ